MDFNVPPAAQGHYSTNTKMQRKLANERERESKKENKLDFNVPSTAQGHHRGQNGSELARGRE